MPGESRLFERKLLESCYKRRITDSGRATTSKKASSLVSVVERYRALAEMETCEEADQAQLTAVLTMGEG